MIAWMKPAAVLLAALTVATTGCAGNDTEGQSAGSAPAAASDPVPAQDELPVPAEVETNLPPEVRDAILKPFTGDLDEMVKRRVVRVGVTYNRTFYFVDRGVQRGVAYDYGQLIEDRLNARLKTGIGNKIHVTFLPLPRETLASALIDGRVDLVAAQVMVRPELQKLVDFTSPTRVNVNQVLVTGPDAPAVASVDDLSGKAVFVRDGSAYHDSLVALNERFKAEGKTPVEIRSAPPNLEDDDLLEMVNAGLIPAIIVDDYLAKFWVKVFPKIVVHDNVAVHTDGTLAVAIRKNSPQLTQALNTFMGNYGLGTAFASQTERKYLVNTRYAKNAVSEEGRRKFAALVELFRKYGARYDMDFLLMAAQAYQESQLDHNARSPVGAIGIMQVMPATGQELKVGDITQLEPNIHAGVKYMRFTIDTYLKDEPMDALNKVLFAFASYNAGPGRIRQLRGVAAKRGLNPNVWFGNVEQVVSERIGRETVTYVANIYKYYIAYRLVVDERERRAAARTAVTSQ